MGTDSDWEHYGRNDPYFGVLSHARYHRGNLSESARREFFESGESDISRILSACERYFGVGLPRDKALDFGCGVGRLALPLARRFGHVVGVDVSAAMLAEAGAEAQRLQVHNIRFCRSLDEVAGERGTYSFVNSYIVLQHVQPKRGLAYVATMLELLAPDGFAALHATYAREKDRANAGERPLGSRMLQLVGGPLSDLSRRLRRRAPRMQMNPYPLNKLLFMVQDCGARTVHAEFSNHGGHLGVTLFFSKSAQR